MSRDLLASLFPEHTRSLIEVQSKQAAELGRALGPSIQAAQDALKSFGALGLSQETLDVLKDLAPPNLDVYGISPQAMDAAAGMTAGIEVSMFRDMGPLLARALEVPAFLRGINLPTAEELEEGHRDYARAAESLAKAGWTFSMNMAPVDVVDLADKGLDAAALDEWFIEYYGAERGQEFRALASKLLKRKRLKAWRALLREGLWAYRRGRYRLVIPALLATIEGLVCEVTGTIRERGVNASKQWQERAEKPPKGFMVEVEWCAVAAFLESLWSRYHFDGPAPGGLNRHWVLHGRWPQVGGRADALRLLAAVDFIAEAAGGVERLTKRLQRKRRAG